MPTRIKLMRARGWQIPVGAVKVDRTTKWGNPYRIAPQQADNPYGSATDAVSRFRDDIMLGKATITEAEIKAELAGKDLACWCDLSMPCHADMLMEIANGP
jgi:hypothetical protein